MPEDLDSVIRSALVGPVDPTDPDDAAAMARLRRAWMEEWSGGPLGDPHFEERMRVWLVDESPRRTVWRADLVRGDADAVGPVGMISLVHVARMPAPGRGSEGWGYVGGVFVRAEHRNRGVGRELLDAVLAEARTRRYDRVVLHPSARSIPLYRRAGFRGADELLVHPLDG